MYNFKTTDASATSRHARYRLRRINNTAVKYRHGTKNEKCSATTPEKYFQTRRRPLVRPDGWLDGRALLLVESGVDHGPVPNTNLTGLVVDREERVLPPVVLEGFLETQKQNVYVTGTKSVFTYEPSAALPGACCSRTRRCAPCSPPWRVHPSTPYGSPLPRWSCRRST